MNNKRIHMEASRERKLVEQVQTHRDQQAMKQLIDVHKQRMVAMINRLTKKFYYGLDRRDLYAAAVNGFIEGIYAFNLKYHGKNNLWTFAQTYVFKAVTSDIHQQTNLIHVPQDLLSSKSTSLSVFANQLAQYEATGPSVDLKAYMMAELQLTKEADYWKLVDAYRARYQCQSWDAPLPENDNEPGQTTFGETVSQEQVRGVTQYWGFMDPLKHLIYKEFAEGLRRVLERMSTPAKVLFAQRIMKGIPAHYFSKPRKTPLSKQNQTLLKPLQDYVVAWFNG